MMDRQDRAVMDRLSGTVLKSLQTRPLVEFLIVFRFTIVGLLATAVHIGVATSLIAYWHIHPIAANAAAFLLAFMVSFTGHFHWSFKPGGDRKLAFVRFFLVAVSAFALNNMVLVWLLKARLLSDIASTVTAVFVIPLFTFILSRFWAFRPQTAELSDAGNIDNTVDNFFLKSRRLQFIKALHLPMNAGNIAMKIFFKSSMYYEYFLVVGLLAILSIQLFSSMERVNILGDEVPHLGAGYSYWKTRDFRLNREHPPLVKLVGSLPLLFEDLSTQQSWPYFLSAPKWDTAARNEWDFGRTLLLVDNDQQLESNLRAARRSVSVFVLTLAVCVYFFSKWLFGIRGGLISLLATVFNPEILAHGCLITTDMAMATFYFVVPICLWWYFQRPSVPKLAGIGLMLGFSLASKYSNLLLLPVLIVLVFAALFLKSPCHDRSLTWFNPFGAGTPVKRGMFLLSASLTVLAASALVIWASYLFVEPFSQYWSGYQQVYKNSNPNFEHFLLGKYSTYRFWNYFLVTTGLKTPLPVFFLLTLALGAYFACWRKTLSPITKWVLFFPPLLLFIVISLKALNIGHRYVLGIYPYLFVLLGMSGYWLRDIGKQSFRCCSVLTLLTALGTSATVYSGVGAYPFYLAYHNAIVPSDMDFMDYLDDSNNDWGQGWKELARIQKEEHLPPLFVYQFFNPGGDVGGIHGNWVMKGLTDEAPAPGVHALSVNLYRRNKDWFQKHHLFNPLLQTYKPMRIIAGSIVLIDVPYPSLVEQKNALLTETSFYPNGELQNLKHYYLNEKGDKVLSGLNQIWNEENNLSQTAYYIDGHLSGPYSLWTDTGKLAESGYMWNGKIHGAVQRWDDSGKLAKTLYYLEGDLMVGQ